MKTEKKNPKEKRKKKINHKKLEYKAQQKKQKQNDAATQQTKQLGKAGTKDQNKKI